MSISKNVVDSTKAFIERNENSFKSYPIKIEEIVWNEKINIVEHEFNDEASGILVINDENITIGVDKNSGNERKRFTIAHELGHYVLHNERSNMFVDKVFFRKKSDGYTSKEEKIEREANYFAANILMPEKLIFQAVSNLTCDLYEDETVSKLAKDFNVSSSAMLYRLINLGVL